MGSTYSQWVPQLGCRRVHCAKTVLTNIKSNNLKEMQLKNTYLIISYCCTFQIYIFILRSSLIILCQPWVSWVGWRHPHKRRPAASCGLDRATQRGPPPPRTHGLLPQWGVSSARLPARQEVSTQSHGSWRKDLCRREGKGRRWFRGDRIASNPCCATAIFAHYELKNRLIFTLFFNSSWRKSSYFSTCPGGK